MPATTAAPTSPSEGTRRAQQAAREAAIHLNETRSRGAEVAAKAGEIERANRENGFTELIRQAFGGNV